MKHVKNKWEPPQGDVLKVNFDGVISERKQIGAMGVVVHNAKEKITAARAGKRNLCSPLLFECETTFLALRTTLALGITKFVLEGDSKEVINSLEGALKDYPSEIRLCIEDYRNYF